MVFRFFARGCFRCGFVFVFRLAEGGLKTVQLAEQKRTGAFLDFRAFLLEGFAKVFQVLLGFLGLVFNFGFQVFGAFLKVVKIACGGAFYFFAGVLAFVRGIENADCRTGGQAQLELKE